MTQANTLLLQDIVDHLESTRKLMTPAALREVVLHDIQASPELREALARNPKVALDAQGAYRYKVGGLSTLRVSVSLNTSGPIAISG